MLMEVLNSPFVIVLGAIGLSVVFATIGSKWI